MKAWYGDAATAENNFAYDWLPKLDKPLRRAAGLRAHAPGQGQRLRLPGLQSAGVGAEQEEAVAAPGQAEVPGHHRPAGDRDVEFWENHGEFNDVDPAKIQTEVFRLPSTCFAEEDGSLVNSGRWLQWHWKGARAAGRGASPTRRSWRGIFLKLRELYAKDGGAFPDPILNLTWTYINPGRPVAGGAGARKFDRQGAASRRRPIPKDPTKVLVKAGEQLAGFAELRDDGITACGCWIYRRRLDARRAT